VAVAEVITPIAAAGGKKFGETAGRS